MLALSWKSEMPMPSFAAFQRLSPPLAVPAAIWLDRRLDGVLELLLGARDDALGGSGYESHWSTSTPMA